MTSRDLEEVLQRARRSPEFREQLRTDPHTALAGYHLTPAELRRIGDEVAPTTAPAAGVRDLFAPAARTSEGGTIGPHRLLLVAGVVALVASSFAAAWLLTDTVHDGSSPATLPARTHRAVALAPTSGATTSGAEPTGTGGNAGGRPAANSGLESSTAPEFTLGGPTLTPTVEDPTGATSSIGETLGVGEGDGVLRFLDPCADGSAGDCPAGVTGTILALTDPGPFQILGATLSPLPGVDPAYDLCRSYYGPDLGRGSATLAIYSTHPGEFTIQGSAVRSTASGTGGTSTGSETSSQIPRTEATTTTSQTNTWIRELVADHPNPGVITCLPLRGISPGDGVRLRIQGRTLASLVGQYTRGGTDTYELSSTYVGPQRGRPQITVRALGALELEVTMYVREGEFSAVAAKEITSSAPSAREAGALASSECASLRPPFANVSTLPGSAVHVARFQRSARVPEAVVRSPAWPYDPAYRDVWTWRLDFPQGIERQLLAVCGWAFDDTLQVRDAQTVPVLAETGLRVEVDVALHDLAPGSFSARDLWLELRGGRGTCEWENPSGTTGETRICALAPSSVGRFWQVRANVPARGTGPPARSAITSFALRTECLREGQITCNDFEEHVRIGLPAFGQGYGELTLKYRTGSGGGCFGCFGLHQTYWNIGAAGPVSLSGYPPLDIPARAQPRLVLRQTRLERDRLRGYAVPILDWVTDRPVLITAAVERFERGGAATDRCLGQGEVTGGSEFRTSGRLVFPVRAFFDCDGLYYVSVTMTSENGVVSSYDSVAPLRPGGIGNSIVAELP